MERILLAANYSNLSQLEVFVQGKTPVLHYHGEKTLAFSFTRSFVHEHRFSIDRLFSRDWTEIKSMIDCLSNNACRRSFRQRRSLKVTLKWAMQQLLKDQILTRSITGEQTDHKKSLLKMRGILFNFIFNNFTKLECLKLYQNTPSKGVYVFFVDPLSVLSSTLVELHISTYLFEDCHRLLDGRFDQLRTFTVHIFHIWSLILSRLSWIQ